MIISGCDGNEGGRSDGLSIGRWACIVRRLDRMEILASWIRVAHCSASRSCPDRPNPGDVLIEGDDCTPDVLIAFETQRVAIA
jgi:hypothetical protein